jgi:3-deoxy-D-manno-octulosonate 8-phosphate phosphatase (KDO 8-P phosphatase)
VIPVSDHIRERAKAIRLVVLDVDGVLTDGSLYYGEAGEQFKRFHVRDGMGIRMLQHLGIPVAVISARPSKVVGSRMADLKIKHWVTGKDDKVAALTALLQELNLNPREAAFLGDDILDVPVMLQVGLAVAVADAHPFVRQVAHLVTKTRGGHGAARELSDIVLEARFGATAAYERFLADTYAASH